MIIYYTIYTGVSRTGPPNMPEAACYTSLTRDLLIY